MQGENTERTELLREMAWRLNSAAEQKDLKQVEIANALDERPATVGNWFQGLNYPRRRQRKELARLLDVSEAWLFEGAEQRNTVTVEEVEQSSYGDLLPVRKIPVISWAHAGTAVSYEEMPQHFQGHVPTTSRDKRAFGLVIEGDSMQPKWLTGDVVIVEPHSVPRNGKAVVVKFVDDAVQLRIYNLQHNGRIRLTPLNPIYVATEHTKKEFNWIWPVCQTVRNE